LTFVVATLIAGVRVRTSAPSEAFATFNTPNVWHFGLAGLVAGLLIVPWQALWQAGLLLGLVGVSYVLIVLRRVRRQRDYQPVLEDWLFHTVLPLVSYSALVVAALLLPGQPAPTLFVIAGATVLLLFIGIHNAWDNVTYIALELSQRQDRRARLGICCASSCKTVGGNEQLPLAVARSLPQGCIQLGHQLVALERTSEASLILTFAAASGTRQVHCDRAILALPFSALRHVEYRRAGFDALKHQAIQELGYGTIFKLFLQFDRPYWYERGPWPHPANGFVITDLDIQTLWNTSRGQPGASGLLVDYTSGHRGAAYAPPTAYSTTDDFPQLQQYAQNCLQQLESVFPGISAHYTGKAALSYPTGDPFLLGSYACWRVGQYTHFGGYERVRQGPVHFAGEHCWHEFQGYMDGAAREGARAALEIVREVASGRYGASIPQD
jgi:hypothetical protein